MKFNVIFSTESNGRGGKNLESVFFTDSAQEAIRQAMDTFKENIKLPAESFIFNPEISMSSSGSKSYSENFEAIPALFRTQDRETGNAIEEFFSQDDAESAIKEYEERDKKDEVFSENYYEVAEFLQGCEEWYSVAYLEAHPKTRERKCR